MKKENIIYFPPSCFILVMINHFLTKIVGIPLVYIYMGIWDHSAKNDSILLGGSNLKSNCKQSKKEQRNDIKSTIAFSMVL